MSLCEVGGCDEQMVTGYYRETGRATDRRLWKSTPWRWCLVNHGPDGTEELWAPECAVRDHSWRPLRRRLDAEEDEKRPYDPFDRNQQDWRVCEHCGMVRYG